MQSTTKICVSINSKNLGTIFIFEKKGNNGIGFIVLEPGVKFNLCSDCSQRKQMSLPVEISMNF